ncbi:MAG TPA: hypothetical protein P5213_02980 [Rectinema sp.]|nr:hypothetical protein [Rectinema sp.]
MQYPNLKVRYRRINEDDQVKLDSIVDLKQQGADVLYVIRFFKSTEKYYLAKTHWKPDVKKFVVDMSKGDYILFHSNLDILKQNIPLEGVF